MIFVGGCALYIAICEDSAQDMKYLKTAVERIVSSENLDFQISTFADGESFLRHIAQYGVPSISFLDIYMGEVSGLELAMRIRTESEQAVIIFSTTSCEHMAQGWDVGAAHYLVKPYSEEKVTQAMQRAFLIVDRPERYLTFSVNRQPKKIPFSHILYIESRNKYCHIFTQEREYTVLAKLSDLEEQLDDPRFLRCHQSFIVNMDYIEKLGEHDFILKNNALAPIRRRDRSAVVAEYEEYIFKKVRESL
jgi:DNA-binding LytR/AlgR family response regulator